MWINADNPFASWFMIACASSFLLVYALPLFLAPLDWARRFRWKMPDGNNDLTVYFGRCVGGVACAVIITVLRAAGDPRKNAVLLELIGWIGVAMVIVHVWGAIRRTQPWTEDAEIPLYAALGGLAFYLHATIR